MSAPGLGTPHYLRRRIAQAMRALAAEGVEPTADLLARRAGISVAFAHVVLATWRDGSGDPVAP